MKPFFSVFLLTVLFVSSPLQAEPCEIYSGLSKNRIARIDGEKIYAGAATGPVVARFVDGALLDGAFGARTLARIEGDRVYEGRITSKVLANLQEGVLYEGLTRHKFLALIEDGRIYADRERRSVIVNSGACSEEQLLVFAVIYMFFN